ncbi:MAG: ComEC/Rec2 family competence protein, partial [Candidatus Brocadiaceae bacterium]
MPTDPAGTPDRRAASRHRPLVPVLAGFAGGIALDGAFGPPLWFWLALGAALLPAILWGLRRRPAAWGAWVLALVLVVPVGGLYHAVRFRLKPSWHLQNLALTEEGLYVVRGRVTLEPRRHYREVPFASEEQEAPGFWALRVDVQALRGEGGEWRRSAGGLTVFLNEEPSPLHVGDAVQFPARVSSNRPPTNPGERDRALTYARHGSYGTAAVASGRLIAVRERAAWYTSPRAAVGRLRSILRRRLERQLPEGERKRAGLIRALMFGEREALTPRQARLLKETDTLHFLAISGLHVGMFCFFVTGLLVWTGVSVKTRYVLTIVLIWLYVTFTGLHVSAARAGLVLSFLLGAPLLRRPSDGPSALMGAALIILLVSPQQLFSAGFQLTFVAVWAIVTLYPQVADVLWPWEDFLGRAWSERERTVRADLWRGGRSYLLLSFIVWAVTAPIRVYHFNSVSFVAPLLNMVAWPLVAVLLVVGFLLVGSLLLCGWAAAPLVGMALFLTDDINWVVAQAGGLPGAGVHLPSPPLWWVGLCYAALGVWATRRRLWDGRRLFVILVLVLGLTYVWQDAAVRLGREFQMTVADVGH